MIGGVWDNDGSVWVGTGGCPIAFRVLVGSRQRSSHAIDSEALT